METINIPRLICMSNGNSDSPGKTTINSFVKKMTDKKLLCVFLSFNSSFSSSPKLLDRVFWLCVSLCLCLFVRVRVYMFVYLFLLVFVCVRVCMFICLFL